MTEFELQLQTLTDMIAQLTSKKQELGSELASLVLSKKDEDAIVQNALSKAQEQEIHATPFANLAHVYRDRITMQAVKNAVYKLLKLPYGN